MLLFIFKAFRKEFLHQKVFILSFLWAFRHILFSYFYLQTFNKVQLFITYLNCFFYLILMETIHRFYTASALNMTFFLFFFLFLCLLIFFLILLGRGNFLVFLFNLNLLLFINVELCN
jgi:hypothetical protein